jgi:hypothetical protein
VTRGPLWSGARWAAIARLQAGGVSARVEDWLAELRVR